MKKFFSLLKATTKGDLNIFKVKTTNKKSGFLILLLLSFCLMVSSYYYAEIIATPLKEVNLTFVMLTIFSLFIVAFTIMEGIYKAQGIIFDAKDNNLLFSMPIKRSDILFIRIIKVLLFDYIFIILFFVPCIIKYAILETPDISFYFVSLLFMLLLPLIPMVIASIIGYFIKLLSTKFKKKKSVQTMLSLIIFFALYYFLFNMEGFVSNLAQKATSINNFISKLYIPVGLYVDLINDFNIVKLLEMIFISIIPFILFVKVFSIKYEKVVNSSKEYSSNKKNKTINVKKRCILRSLLKKEIKTYFGIPVYIINTIIGPLLAIVGPIIMAIKNDDIIDALVKDGEITLAQINQYVPFIFIGFIIILLSLSTITASSISLEGKKINIIKSMPINTKSIFSAKILLSDIIMVPAFLIGALIFILKMKIFNYQLLFILILSILLPHLNALVGIFANLLFPKLDFNSEIEVVKQGIPVLISIFAGLLFGGLSFIFFGFLYPLVGDFYVMIIYILLIILLIILLKRIINTFGVRKFLELY